MLVRPADRAVAPELANNLSKDLLALAVSVRPSGIEKIAPQLNCAAQRRQRLRVI
jgi:hypothetical protein